MILLDRLQSGPPLLADGATGSLLQTMGLAAGEAPERWVFERPECVAEVARLYAGAGSDLVYSCTFGANRIRMERCGLGGQIADLNRRAVELARKGVSQVGRQVLVAGSIGPTGEMLEPYGDLTLSAAREAFAEQVAALAATDVDLIVCETFTDLDELLMCLEVVRAATAVPVFASMAFEQNGRTMMGTTAQDAVERLTSVGAAGAGANCSVGPDALEAVVTAMRDAVPDVRLLAKPNAGLPQLVDGRTVYVTGPAALAEFARHMKALGAAIVGGCCGTTPEHLRAMRAALDE